MAQSNSQTKNTFFNFRLSKEEMEKLRQAAKKFGYLSFAEFIRAAIRELIKKEMGERNDVR